MGAGQLNAKRALDQFSPGEYDSIGTANVPAIGWDYGTVDNVDGDVNKYVIDEPLDANKFVSITLAWDREVFLEIDNDGDGEFDIDDTFEEFTFTFNDLNLYLLPRGATDTNAAVAKSTSRLQYDSGSTVEHIFAEVPTTGEYEIWVEMFESIYFGGFQNYAVAWWYGLAPEPLTPGDFNGDGSVDGNDFLVWQACFGPNDCGDADGDGDTDGDDFLIWQTNFGTGAGSGAASVPEPSSAVLIVISALTVAFRKRLTASSRPALPRRHARLPESGAPHA